MVTLGFLAVASLRTVPRPLRNRPPEYGLAGFLPLLGVIIALLAIGFARSTVPYRWVIVTTAGFIIIGVGGRYLTAGEGHLGSDFGWAIRGAFGCITILGGIGMVSSTVFATLGRSFPSLPNTGLNRTPLALPFVIALVAMFGLSGPLALLLSVVLVRLTLHSAMSVLLIQVVRSRQWRLIRQIGAILSGLGGVFVLFGFGGPGGCVDVMGESPFTVYYNSGQNLLHFGPCSTQPLPVLFVLGLGLLISGPMLPLCRRNPKC